MQWFNRTILAVLRRYVSELMKDWAQCTEAIIYGYISKVHRATGLTAFHLNLTRPPVHLSLENTATIEEPTSKHKLRERFQARLRALIKTARAKITLAQALYKSEFDRRAKSTLEGLKPGDMVSLLRKTPGDGTNHKLERKVSGPFKVLRKSFHSAVILNIEGLEDTVLLDRVVKAPVQQSPNKTPTGTEPTEDFLTTDRLPEEASENDEVGEDSEHQRNKQAPKTTQAGETSSPLSNTQIEGEHPSPYSQNADTEGEFMMTFLINFEGYENKFRVRWERYGGKDDTCQPPLHVPYNMMCRYFRTGRRPIPAGITAAVPDHLRENISVDTRSGMIHTHTLRG